uniref:Uncharacterized protein n=1 Tax=Peronospora matthiolae TaxID=2874970 RepID=A0AAV1TP71_9STRA
MRSEDVKVDLLDIISVVQLWRYFYKQVEMWWNQRAKLDYVMCQLLAIFETTITAIQAMKLFTQRKDSKRKQDEHFLYMVVVSDAHKGADSLMLDNIVHHASPDLKNVMRAKDDPTRVAYLRHAEELAHFAQSIELGYVGNRM